MKDITTIRLPPGTANERCFSVLRMTSTGNHMSLKAQLDARRGAFEASTPPGIVAALQRSIAELVQTGLVRQVVRAGERAPLFRLRSNTGAFVSLSEAVDRGPVVVSFFRAVGAPFAVWSCRHWPRRNRKSSGLVRRWSVFRHLLTVTAVQASRSSKIRDAGSPSVIASPSRWLRNSGPPMLRSGTLNGRKRILNIGCCQCRPRTSSIATGL